jgi:hypothetical protein
MMVARDVVREMWSLPSGPAQTNSAELSNRKMTTFDLLLALLLFQGFIIDAADAVKQRSWLGPDYFVEGNFPSPRSKQGLVAVGNNTLYVFGGTGSGDAIQSIFYL